jgi:transcriptional regulator with XRE-family HTH domain
MELEESRSSLHEPNLEHALSNLDEPFSDSLRTLIQSKGKTEVEVYKKANLDRKLFSKIRKGGGYVPSKRTVIALAIALDLTLDEADKLLEKAGYALSHSSIFDVIIEYFIVHKHYKILEINEVLFSYDQPLLGSQ